MKYCKEYWSDINEVIKNIPVVERLRGKCVMITGATGLIGSSVADVLCYLNRGSAKKIRKAIKKQLQYLRRDLGYIDDFMECEDIEFTEKQLQRIQVIREVYQQQEYMYLNNVYSVPNRIVSISQPYIRPIVRERQKHR